METLSGVEPRRANVPLYSTVTGEVLDGSEMDAEYWFTNLRQPVLFEQATRKLMADGHAVFVECSPHPVLTVGVQETAEAAGSGAVTVGSLRRDEGGMDRFLTSLAQAHAYGASVDWTTVFPTGTAPVDLPTYAFQHERFWLTAAVAGAPATPVAWASRPPITRCWVRPYDWLTATAPS
ncbi:acyltransferase domain-containing protein [Streptomyces sp. M19]